MDEGGFMLGKATEERPNESRIMSTATIVLLIIMVVATGNLSRQSEYLNKTVSTGSVRSNFLNIIFLPTLCLGAKWL